jgi:hypothetical protein
MESLEFLLVLAVFAAVLSWYLRNEAADSDGHVGLLSLADDPDTAKPGAQRRSYRIKPRIAQRAHQRRMESLSGVGAETSKGAFRTASKDDRLLRRYRRQDEVRYRVKDKASRYKNTDDAGAA